MVKGLALTIPLSALPALEADPDVLSVSIDHPMKGLDDVTDVATGRDRRLDRRLQRNRSWRGRD